MPHQCSCDSGSCDSAALANCLSQSGCSTSEGVERMAGMLVRSSCSKHTCGHSLFASHQ